MPFNAYLKAIRENLQRGDATEHTHRPALKVLVEALEKRITATNEPKRVECGAPDYVVSRSTKHGPLTIGYIEAKDVGKSLDEAERSEQIKRYLPLGNLILTDYLEFRWYVDGEHRQTASLGRLAKGGKIVADKEGQENVNQLLTSFLDRKPPPIDKPKDLAERLARLTHLIRDIIEEAFEKEQASTIIKDLHRAFEEVLIPDLAIPQFADMFAQTLAYGLFAAYCNHEGPPELFQRLGAAQEIPKTNPFLRRLFDLMTGTALDDEPFVGFVDDLVQLLRQTNIEAVLADFGKRTRREDPIIHFYETFLAEYNPTERRTRGIYYTPEPVVSYIVRSIDHLLKTRFGCPGGLADTKTVEYTREDDEGKKHTESAPRVLILDPACGTGTFLYSVVDLIREEFMRRGDAGMWSGYVREHLLPRLFGFELLMAPYAVSHLKLGMQLAGQDLPEAQRESWAYDFSGDERLGVYLTNTLEEAERRAEDLFGPLRVITEEANAASEIKRDLPIMVVTGNPPYSSSIFEGEWIMGLIEDYKRDLKEKKVDLNREEWKFLRFAQHRIEKTGVGVLAFIINNSFIDAITFRRMRQHLMNLFSGIYILNLHGSVLSREKRQLADQNVFDIEQGVAIAIFVKEPTKRKGTSFVHHSDLWGSREHKYSYLFENNLSTTKWTKIKPRADEYFFIPRTSDLEDEYKSVRKLPQVFEKYSSGIQTKKDRLTIQFDPDTVIDVIRGFSEQDVESAREHYNLGKDGSDWKVSLAQKDVRESGCREENVVPMLYRPFDIRFTYYTGKTKGFHGRPRRDIMRHMLSGPNLALIAMRQTVGEARNHFGATRLINCHGTFYLGNRGQDYLFPLYLYPLSEGEKGAQKRLLEAFPLPTGKEGRRPNLNPDFIKDVEKRLGFTFVSDGAGDLQKSFGPEDIFHYMYAVFHSPTYRERYAEFLKIDFPRLPLTSDKKLFAALAGKGQDLAALHLMESPALKDRITNYPVTGDHLVEKGHPRYLAPGEQAPGEDELLTEGRVYIGRDDKKAEKRGQYFEGVPPEVWEFHVGGYQVCQKWLKDRRGRTLTFDDIQHYQKIVVALQETIRLMGEVDALIPSWPIV